MTSGIFVFGECATKRVLYQCVVILNRSRPLQHRKKYMVSFTICGSKEAPPKGDSLHPY